MTGEPTLFDADGNSHPATSDDIAAILGQYTALDGTSYTDMWEQAQDEDGTQ